MSYGGYNYGGYPGPGGYYSPPSPDQLAQLRQQQFQQPVMGQQPMMQGQTAQQAQQMQQPVMAQPTMQPTPQPTISGPYYVSGDAGARGYLVAANTTVLLFDADPDASTFWLKSADAAGMPSMRTFDYTERTNAPKAAQTPVQAPMAPDVEYVPRADFDALAARCEAIEAELTALKNKPVKPAAAKKAKEETTDE